MIYLRARWYDAGSGVFVQRDPFAGFAERPYSLHPYQYGYANPARWTDPSGRCVIFLSYSHVALGGHHVDIFLDERPKCDDCVPKDPSQPYIPFHEDTESFISSLFVVGGTSENPEVRLGHVNDEFSSWGHVRAYARYIGSEEVAGYKTPRVILVNNDFSCDKYRQKMIEFVDRVNNASVLYNPTGPNSNTVARGALQSAGINTVGILHPLLVPGFERDLFQDQKPLSSSDRVIEYCSATGALPLLITTFQPITFHWYQNGILPSP